MIGLKMIPALLGAFVVAVLAETSFDHPYCTGALDYGKHCSSDADCPDGTCFVPPVIYKTQDARAFMPTETPRPPTECCTCETNFCPEYCSEIVCIQDDLGTRAVIPINECCPCPEDRVCPEYCAEIACVVPPPRRTMPRRGAAAAAVDEAINIPGTMKCVGGINDGQPCLADLDCPKLGFCRII